MLRIDQLIHAFHVNLVNQHPSETRAAAVNLIEGRYHEVVHFLDRLSYAPESTIGVQSTRREWREIINRTAEEWGDESLRLDPE